MPRTVRHAALSHYLGWTGRLQQNIYRPVLVTTRGEFPLAPYWMDDEKQAERTVYSVNRFRENPESPGFSMWHDDRPRASRMGAVFTGAAVLVLLLGL